MTLIPTEVHAAGPAPTLEYLEEAGAKLAAALAGETFEPAEIADMDQLAAAEQMLGHQLRDAAASRPDLDYVTRAGDVAHALACRFAIAVAMFRHVEAHCPHVSWPPRPIAGESPVAVVLTCRAAVCGRSKCQGELRSRWTDDGLCELCEAPADYFHPSIVPQGHLVISLEVCERCYRWLRR